MVLAGRPELLVREAELGLLLSDYATVAAGAGGAARIVVLEGPPGSGKTELIGAFAAAVTAAGATLRRGDGGAPPDTDYGAVARVLRVQPVSSPDSSLSSLSGQLFETLNVLSANGPLVLVVDRAEFCDEASLRWLDLAVRRHRDQPLMVVLSRRASVVPGWVHVLDAAGAAADRRTIILDATSDNDVAALAERWWGQRPDEEFVRAANAHCAGLPGLLNHLFAELRDAGFRPDRAGAGPAAERGARLLAGHLVEVLAGLPDYLRRVAYALAVLGRIEVEPVAMLAGVSATLVSQALALLEDEGVPGRIELGGPRCVAVAAAVRAGMPGPEQVALRERAARVLNDIGGTAEEISDHLLHLPVLSEPWMPAVLRDAADRAERTGDVARAARLRRPLVSDGPAPVDDVIDLARVLVHLDAGAAHALVSDALESAGEVRDRAALAIQFGKSAIVTGQVPQAVRLVTRVLGELLPVIGNDPDPADQRLWMRTEAALLSLGWNETATVAAISARAGAIRTPAGNTRNEREVLAVQAVTAALAGRDPGTAQLAARRAIGTEPDPGTWMFAAAAYALALTDEVDEAIRGLDRVETHTRERGLVWVQVSALLLRCWIRRTSGDLPAAIQDAMLALELSDAQPWAHRISTPRVTVASVLLQQGETARAIEMLARVEPVARGSVLMQPQLLMTRSAVSLAAGDRAGALEYALACGRFLAEAGVANPVFLPWWLEAAPLLVEFGREQEAREAVEHGTRLAAQWGSGTGHGLTLLARGSICSGPEQLSALGSAVEVLAATPSAWYLTRARIAFGDALVEAGDRTGARTQYREAADGAVRGGYRPLACAARARSVGAGGRTVRSVLRDGMLTPSEYRVAVLAARGATNRETATALVIALRTVEIHLTSVYRKLKITGRAELAQALEQPPAGATG